MCSDVLASVLMKAPVLCFMTQCILVYAPLVRQHFLLLSSGDYLESEGSISGRSSSYLLRVNGHGAMCRKTGCIGQSPVDKHDKFFETFCPHSCPQGTNFWTVPRKLFTKLLKLTADCTCTFVACCICYSCYLHLLSSGFGGLEVVCWPLVPKFAGSHPAETVGFFGRKYPQHAFLRRGSKAVGPML
jgi:hypothetical protein